MSDLLDLSGASFPEVKSALGLTRYKTQPFYRNSRNRPVFFRSEHKDRKGLLVAHDDNSVYGCGAYLGNSPFAVTSFLGSTDEHGVSVYELPEIVDGKIKRCYTRISVDSGSAELVVFPTPLITQALFRFTYPESRHEELPQYWGLLRLATAAEKIQETQKIAWLGKECVGAPRFTLY